MAEPSFASLEPKLLARKGGAKPAMRPQLAPLVSDADETGERDLDEGALEDLGWNDMGDAPESDHAGAVFEDYDTDYETSAEAYGDLGAHSQSNANAAEEDAAHTELDDSASELIPAKRAARAHPIIDPLSSADIVDLSERRDRRAANEDFVANGREKDEEASAFPEFQATASDPVVREKVRKSPLFEDACDFAEIEDTHRGDEAITRAASMNSRPAPSANVAGGRRAAFTLRLDAQRHLKLRLAATMKGESAQALVTAALDQMLAEIDGLDAIAARMKRD